MRSATIRTEHDAARIVAAAVEPDNSSEMTTLVDGDVVQTTIERETTDGLRATLDDYVVNVDVATAVLESADSEQTRSTTTEDSTSRSDTVTTDSKEFSATDRQ